MTPSARQAARIRRLVEEAGGADVLVSWIRQVRAQPRGRPIGSSRYNRGDEALLAAIRAAGARAGKSMDELIRLNMKLMPLASWGASTRAVTQRLRKKSRALK